MRANHDEIRTIGEDLLNRTTAAQQDAPLGTAPTLSGPLSQGLASAHSTKASAATEFLGAVQQGMTQAANTLVQVASGLAGIDGAGADAVTQALEQGDRDG
jgi:hypothetical protein